MTPRPWKPELELNGAIKRGDLRYATILAEELRIESGRPIPLDQALGMVALAAATDDFEAWARRWLARWLTEAQPTMDQAADVAAALAELPAEPQALDGLLGLLHPHGPVL
jgi:hypothetical protein